MNTLETCRIINPQGFEDDGAMFIVDDTTVPFSLHDITTVGEHYTLNFWIKSQSIGSLTVYGNTIQTSDDWVEHTVMFTADEIDIDLIFAATNTYYIYHPKLEIGNKSTDWTPAPEDVDKEIDNVKDSFSGSISGLDDRLSAAETLMGTFADGMVTFVYDDTNNSFTLQSPNGETFAVTETEKNIKNINDKIASIIHKADDTTEFTKQIEALVKEHGIALNYVHEGTYEDKTGNKLPCLLLGESDTIFKLRITNKAIEFIEDYGSDADGQPIVEVPAYITNDGEKSKMMIENAEVKEEFKQGGFVWVTHGNGNLGLTWKGGTS